MNNFKFLLILIVLNSCKQSLNNDLLNEKRMVEIADSVYNSRINNRNETIIQSKNQIIGNWGWEAANGNFFNLTFSKNGEVKYQAYRMPFEEILTWKENGKIIELYYKKLSDSSFEKDKNFKCSKLVAKCYKISENEMNIDVLNDICGYMEKGSFNLNKFENQ